jgi:hypothetical protein
MTAQYLNNGRRNLVEFVFSMSEIRSVPVKGDFIEYDGLGFEVVARTFDYRNNSIRVRGYCNYEGTELEYL